MANSLIYHLLAFLVLPAAYESIPVFPPLHGSSPDNDPLDHLRGVRGPSRGVDWSGLAQEELRASLYNFPQIGVAKNVILFLGDGMGPSDITAARWFLAQRRKTSIEQTHLSFEKFPVTGLSKTYTADRQTADSAGAATALLCGEKVNFYTVGVKDSVPLYNCSALSEEAKLKSILKHSMDKGKWTGLVTTTRVTHASPSAAYAHSADRNGEANIPLDTAIEPDKCEDIAKQLVTGVGNKNIRVIMGGGRNKLYPCNEKNGECTTGDRKDDRNLTAEWLKIKGDDKVKPGSYHYITTSEQLKTLNENTTDYLLGLFADEHMAFEVDRQRRGDLEQPSLVDMVDKAVRILRRAEEGFFLFVEGGLIDKGHHANLPYKALDETVMFAEAVERAMNLTNQKDTLIVVTGDHSHVFNIAGYPEIDNDILGTYISKWEPGDRMPYTTLQYVNGPGFNVHREVDGTLSQRRNLTGVDTTGPDYVFDAGIPNDDETHGGEDVAIFARGPMSYLLGGSHQQHYVAHALMYASCVGPNLAHCENPLPTLSPPPTASTAAPRGVQITSVLLVAAIVFCMLYSRNLGRGLVYFL